MISIKKIQIPQDTRFDRKVALELANLISVAYNEYEVWDVNEELQHENQLPSVITGSQDFADLEMDSLECQMQSGESRNTDFEKLNQLWAISKSILAVLTFSFLNGGGLNCCHQLILQRSCKEIYRNFGGMLKILSPPMRYSASLLNLKTILINFLLFFVEPVREQNGLTTFALSLQLSCSTNS